MSDKILKYSLSLSAIIIAVSVSYYLLIATPKKQALQNCISSYTSDYEDSIIERLRMSKLDLCKHGYGLTETLALFRATATAIGSEYSKQYADITDDWVKDKMDDEINERVRKSVLESKS